MPEPYSAEWEQAQGEGWFAVLRGDVGEWGRHHEVYGDTVSAGRGPCGLSADAAYRSCRAAALAAWREERAAG